MAMTRDEAMAIARALRGGKRFATRFQEESWGLEARPDGGFRKWSERVDPYDGREESSDETLDEEALIVLLTTWYGYERVAAGLR